MLISLPNFVGFGGCGDYGNGRLGDGLPLVVYGHTNSPILILKNREHMLPHDFHHLLRPFIT